MAGRVDIDVRGRNMHDVANGRTVEILVDGLGLIGANEGVALIGIETADPEDAPASRNTV